MITVERVRDEKNTRGGEGGGGGRCEKSGLKITSSLRMLFLYIL